MPLQIMQKFQSNLGFVDQFLDLWIFLNEVLYKQKDGVTMGSPVGSTLGNAFLCFYEKNGLKNALLNLNQFFIEDMLVKCFEKFLDRLHIIKPISATMEKKALRLILPYLKPISLQVRTKIRNAMKSTLNCCKLQVIFKNERKLSNMFRFKDCVPYDLVSGVVYEYTCGRCNSSYYGETERHLKVRSGEHVGISPLTFKKTNRLKRVRYVTTFYSVIITLLLMSLPS